ncbi:spore protease [Pullulanibacillus pueri]|uniref:Germination protease n=1 Tax=Pullulanibacillus pueri TaxID=1437324 RepID=A0A8J2ZX92_9BACL|nr:GPR endopeptidase [Pullulanibacillus pueri]MBM7683065.1 spore protease [Pullulanibacillus pueri]GGH84913.1 germination protease [Pullulanibacillus pueri]
MARDLDLQNYKVRTDLAIEAREILEEKETTKPPEIKGVTIQEEEIEGIKLTRMKIDADAADRIGKKPGHYLTYEVQGIRKQDTELQEVVERVFAKTFAAFIEEHHIPEEASCLVVGLGNRHVTPDALGPHAIENILVTKHLFALQPYRVQEGYRPVSAISPGVMGITGIETSDIILGVIEKTKPDFIIAIDALASRSIERINATIQVSDTGIHPGSGVGNNRKELSIDTLGIPVFAIGIPTVVDAVTITSDTLDFILKHFGRELRENGKPSKALTPSGMNFGERVTYTDEDLPSEEERGSFLGLVGRLSDEEKQQLIREVLGPTGHNMMVTPKEVDTFIEDMANVLASGLNAALHKNINQDNLGAYTH